MSKKPAKTASLASLQTRLSIDLPAEIRAYLEQRKAALGASYNATVALALMAYKAADDADRAGDGARAYAARDILRGLVQPADAART